MVDVAKTIGTRQNLFPYLALCRLGGSNQVRFRILRWENESFVNQLFLFPDWINCTAEAVGVQQLKVLEQSVGKRFSESVQRQREKCFQYF